MSQHMQQSWLSRQKNHRHSHRILPSFRKNRKGNVGIAIVVTLIVVSFVLYIGVYIMGDFELSLPTFTNPKASAAAEAISENTWNGLNLSSMLPMVIAAGGIIGIIIAIFGRMGQN